MTTVDLKSWHIALLILLLVIGGTYKALTHFAPQAFAAATRQMVVELDLKGELHYYEQQKWEFEKNCTNLQTDEWLCSSEKLYQYQQLLIEIQLLRKQLGIG